MNGDIALDTSVAIRLLNKDQALYQRTVALPRMVLPAICVGELLYGAENSNQASKNIPRYRKFIATCVVVPIGIETAALYAQTRLSLKRKGRPMPENDIWIAAQCIEHGWILVTDDSDFNRVDGLVIEQW